MKRRLLNLFFRLYNAKSFNLMKEKQVEALFDYLARTDETKMLGNFFRQIANAYKNKYLYSNDETLKGAVFALTQLTEKFEEHTPKNKMKEEARQKKMVGDKDKRQVKY